MGQNEEKLNVSNTSERSLGTERHLRDPGVSGTRASLQNWPWAFEAELVCVERQRMANCPVPVNASMEGVAVNKRAGARLEQKKQETRRAAVNGVEAPQKHFEDEVLTPCYE